jgi:hypothetical protein
MMLGEIVKIVNMSKKVKLFCGIIFSNEEVKQKSFVFLEKRFSKIALISNVIPFNFSDYYNIEMGHNLKRLWVSFINLIFASDIVNVKIFTNFIEKKFTINSKRQINIDPGYVTLANVILATTKDYSHRIYLRDGIYGEVTTMYKNNNFVKLPWSYPDYLSKVAMEFFLKLRTDLLKQLKLRLR